MKRIHCARSILDNISSWIKSMFNKLDDLIQVDAKIKENEEDEETGAVSITFDIDDDNNSVLLVLCNPVEYDKKTGDVVKFDLSFEDRPGRKKEEVTDVDSKDVDKTIAEIMNLWYATQEDISESTKILMSISRTNTGDIRLAKVQCSAENVPILTEALDTIPADSDFINSVPESDTTYEIVPAEDTLDISECDCCCDESYNSYRVCMMYAKKLFEDCYTIRWNAKGEDLNIVYEMTGMCDYQLLGYIEQLAQFSYECFGYSPDMRTLDFNGYEGVDVKQGFDACQAAKIICCDIREFIDCLNDLYCNVPHDIQNVFDQWIREMKSAISRIDKRMK